MDPPTLDTEVSGMTQKRLAALFGAVLVTFSVVMGRLYLLAQNQEYAQTAQAQTVTTLTLENSRGNLYDCNGTAITGYGQQYYALSIPGESSYAELFQYVPYSEQAYLYEKRNALSPFLVQVDQDLTDQGIYTYSVPNRYCPVPLAEHLIGYLNGDGSGVAGLELAFDELLSSGQSTREIQCVTTAQGSLLAGSEPQLLESQAEGQGVMLTLDTATQRVCEAIAQQSMDTGCILVLDVKTAKVRASVSVPEFDPNNIQASLQDENSPFLNRVLCQYNVGSVFKPVLAAEALERGIGWYSMECEGVITIGDHDYHCALDRAHGLMNIRGALEKSCNCFFIDLGMQLGGARIAELARQFGFGQTVYLAGGLKSAEGVVPEADTLKDLGQLANFSFGQGQLMAAPIQLAAAYNTLAAGGVYCSPGFLEAVIDESSGEVVRNLYQPETRKVVSESTAEALCDMLAGVVNEGIGAQAAPQNGTAAGKTGTAQTAVFDEEGREEMNYWFAGFYPAEDPLYTIVVLQDGTPEPGTSSATVFAQVCDGLFWLQNEETRARILHQQEKLEEEQAKSAADS